MQIKEHLGEKANSPEKVASILQDILQAESEIDRDKEHCWVIGLTTNNAIKYIELVTLGLLNHSLLHPREVYRLAIMQGVNAIILGHNHPSGNIEPSKEDIKTTETIREAGKIIDINLLDQIIITTDGKYESLKETGAI